MFIFSSFRRKARLAAFFAAVIAFVVIGGATRSTAAHAQPVDYGQDIQGQVIAGSELRIFVLDWQDKEPWTGTIEGPSGSIPWSYIDSGTYMTFAHFSDGLEGGTYTIKPGTPIAAGWHVVGYHAFPGGVFGNCGDPSTPFTQAASVTISAQEPTWSVCIAVERDGAIFGSSLNVTIVGNTSVGTWTGGVSGPNSTYYKFDDVFDLDPSAIHNLLPGTWNVLPGNPPKPGYTVAGYYRFETKASEPNCPQNPAAYTGKNAEITVSPGHANWAVCVLVVPAINDSSIWVKLITDGWPTVWEGSVSGPNSFKRSFGDIGIETSSHWGTLFNVAGGTWDVSAAKVPAMGYTVGGYAILEGGIQTTCPAAPGSYNNIHSFQVNDQHPNIVVCILLEHPPLLPNSSLTLGFMSNSPVGANSWDGIVTGPSGIAWAWDTLQIGGPNYMGGKHDIFAGTYSVVAGKPVRPGWVVKGYASYETTQFLQSCPIDQSLYKPSPTPVTFSDAHPNWGICLLVEPAPVNPTPTPFVPPAVEDVPPFEFPEVGFPGGTVVPTATATPSVPAPAATATPTVTKPIQTQVAANPGQTSERPGAEAGGKRDQPASQDAPLPPNTGTGSATGGHGATFLALGALLLALSGLMLAANRLPGRPKR